MRPKGPRQRGMRTGAVAMIDALGFKGIWERFPHQDVLAKMSVLQDRLEDAALDLTFRDTDRLWLKAGVALDADCVFVSDTIYITVAASGGTEEIPANASAVVVAASLAAHAMNLAASGRVPLAYRGCISVGEFGLERNFVIGPAIDDAASYVDAAEGAFTWLVPSARQAFRRFDYESSGRMMRRILMPYSVPLKRPGGDGRHDIVRHDTLVVVPLGGTLDPAMRAKEAQQLLETFGTKVPTKRSNTEAFLQHSEAWLRMQGTDAGIQRMLDAFARDQEEKPGP